MNRKLGRIVWLSVICLSLVLAGTASQRPAVSARSIEVQLASSAIPVNQLIIKYRATADLKATEVEAWADRLTTLSAAAGVKLAYVRPMSGDAHVLGLPERLPVAEALRIAGRLAALPEVEYAEPDYIMQHTLTPNDPLYTNGSQWHYNGTYGINAPGAWDITTGSSNIVVAVVDTGITNHFDLAGRTVAGYDMISDVFMANDGGGRDANPSDPGDWIAANDCYAGSSADNSSWHGTHVAGTIGAATNNGQGVAGINWYSKILPVRVLGKCGGTTSDIVDGMRWAAGLTVSGAPANPNPAKVINISLGGQHACSTTEQNGINAIVAAGTTVIVAAGNNDQNASGFSPASCNGVITVAATNKSGDKASYSNYGAVVEISAPGGDTDDAVLSTLNTGKQGPLADTFVEYMGTSMATPHVVGIASLLYSMYPSLTPAQVNLILRDTVTPFPGGSTCNTSICGTGIANAAAAVAVLPRIIDFSPAAAPAGSGAFTLTVNGGGFVNGAVVKWNGVNRTTSFVSSTQLQVAIDAADVITPGLASLSVQETHPTYGALAAAAKTYLIAGPGFGPRIYLPLIANGFTAGAITPMLNVIDNSDGNGSFNVIWNATAGSTSYVLQEDDNAAFSSPATAYSGAATQWAASSKPLGTYYYRVKATGATGDSGWSNTRSVSVSSAATSPTPGFWDSGVGDEFTVSSDRTQVVNFAIYVDVSGCGLLKITRITPAPIVNNQFSFTGSFYASGTFDSTTAAHGVDGLNNYYSPTCGFTLQNAQWDWAATWQHAQAAAEPGVIAHSDGTVQETLLTAEQPAHSVDKP